LRADPRKNRNENARQGSGVLGGRNDQAALIYDSPVTNTKQTFTYGRLLSEVQLLGAMLRDLR